MIPTICTIIVVIAGGAVLTAIAAFAVWAAIQYIDRTARWTTWMAVYICWRLKKRGLGKQFLKEALDADEAAKEEGR